MTGSPMLLLVILSFLCSQIVVARYCSPEVDHESPTGEYVSFSIDNQKSRIRVRSNRVGWFGWRYAAVRGFKGDGNGYSSRWPTIVSSAVYKSLVSPAALPAVFDGMDKNNIQLALSARRENVRNEEPMDPFEEIKEWVLHFFDKPHTMNLVVKDADKPITIGNREQVFFWGAAKLPNRSGECANYTASNDGRNVSFCKHAEMEQCAAKISVFPQLTPFSLESPQGERLTQFAWLCPKGSACCAWECCEPYGWDGEDTFAIFFLLWGPGSLLLIYVLKRGERRRLADEAKAKTEAEAAPLQNHDQLPTTASTECTTTTEKHDHGVLIKIRTFVMNNWKYWKKPEAAAPLQSPIANDA